MGAAPSRLERQRRLKTRALPLVGIALLAFIFGAIKGCPGSPNRDAASDYAEAWQDHDYERMYGMLSTKSQQGIPLDRFTARYEEAEAIATLQTMEIKEPEGDETNAEVPVTVETLAFGTIEQPLKFTFGSDGIAWQNNLLFPGLELNEELTRTTELPTRAAILAGDGQTMAEGPVDSREHPLGDSMIDVTGVTGEAEAGSFDLAYVAAGYEPGDTVGTSGLELAFNTRLTGTPGGTLFAKPIEGGADGEGRELGSGEPAQAPPLKTTIDVDLQTSAVANLAGQSGGVAVLDARKGFVRALAGSAYSVLQPPGSTMKIVTATAGLESGQATLDSSYDYVSEAPADGRMIQNAHGEICGGSFTDVFANSCNSVFAPLAEQVGAEEMTAVAERYGFNRPPQVWDPEGLAIVDPPVPTIPQADEYESDLGVSGIGQGRVQATPLTMASVAQAVANRGVSLPTPITREPNLQPDAEPVRVTSQKVAGQVADLMVAVVQYGTGAAAAISEGQVAGKTGTAEVGPSGEVGPDGEDILIEDAWFAGFAPSDKPKLAVAVMIIDASGDGGTIAAPIAGAVLSDGL
ncbi:MAG TPA: penicillin-binding transpeptidase domain-containing protein [Solirubrobacterales bacterium]|nr:penicillin-binding transpeptidase domain-containing protein [Solirubrobacterales bacterium]